MQRSMKSWVTTWDLFANIHTRVPDIAAIAQKLLDSRSETRSVPTSINCIQSPPQAVGL